MKWMKNNLDRWMPWALALAFFGLYAWHLNLPDIGGDAAKYALNIAYPHPPLVRSMMWGMQALFGFTPLFARLPLVMLGAAAVGMVFALLRRLGLPVLVAMALTIAFGGQVEWVHWMRAGFISSSLAFFWILAFLGIQRLEKNPADVRGHWLLFFGFVGGCWSQLQGALFLPIFLLIYARQWHRFPHDAVVKTLRWIGVLGLAQAALFFLYIATSPLILADITSFAGSSPKGSAAWHAFAVSDFLWPLAAIALGWMIIILFRRGRLSGDERMAAALSLVMGLFLIKNPASYYAPYVCLLAIFAAAFLLRMMRAKAALAIALALLVGSLTQTAGAYGYPESHTVFTRFAPAIRELIRGEKEIIVLGPDAYQAQYYFSAVNRKLPGDLAIRNRIRFALIVNRAGMTEAERDYAATLRPVATFDRLELLERP
jgi:hypothetical protein